MFKLTTNQLLERIIVETSGDRKEIAEQKRLKFKHRITNDTLIIKNELDDLKVMLSIAEDELREYIPKAVPSNSTIRKAEHAVKIAERELDRVFKELEDKQEKDRVYAATRDESTVSISKKLVAVRARDRSLTEVKYAVDILEAAENTLRNTTVDPVLEKLKANIEGIKQDIDRYETLLVEYTGEYNNEV